MTLCQALFDDGLTRRLQLELSQVVAELLAYPGMLQPKSHRRLEQAQGRPGAPTPGSIRVPAPAGEYYVYLSWVRHPRGAREVRVRVGEVQANPSAWSIAAQCATEAYLVAIAKGIAQSELALANSRREPT